MPRRLASFALLALLLACAPEPQAPIELPDLEGRTRRPLDDPSATATVFLFTRTDCPVSNRYAPTVGALHERFAPRGVAFWLVYLDSDETAESIRAHLSAYRYPMSALRDVEHALVRRTGAEVTPEAAVFDARRALRYRGRIDDRYDGFGRARPEATRHDLAEALEAVLAGRPVEAAAAPAVGCAIADLR